MPVKRSAQQEIVRTLLLCTSASQCWRAKLTEWISYRQLVSSLSPSF
jgi:hypothetical protein